MVSITSIKKTIMHCPARCVPLAAVAICCGGEGVCLTACWIHPPSPQCGPGHPPLVGLETPLARPLNIPPGCGPGDPPGQTPQHPPRVWAWRPPWPDPSTSPLGVGLETPLWTEWLTDRCKNITYNLRKLRLRAVKIIVLSKSSFQSSSSTPPLSNSLLSVGYWRQTSDKRSTIYESN